MNNTKKPRNVVVLSDMPPDLEEWAKSEAQRRRELGLPGQHLYQVVNIALDLMREQSQACDKEYYLADGRGPYRNVRECLLGLGLSQQEINRRKYWNRLDRLPRDYQDQIQQRELEAAGHAN